MRAAIGEATTSCYALRLLRRFATGILEIGSRSERNVATIDKRGARTRRDERRDALSDRDWGRDGGGSLRAEIREAVREALRDQALKAREPIREARQEGARHVRTSGEMRSVRRQPRWGSRIISSGINHC